MRKVRSAMLVRAALCVTMTMVWLKSRCSCLKYWWMISALAESELPVGSSAKMTWGWLNCALAMATRCCSPPDNCPGLW